VSSDFVAGIDVAGKEKGFHVALLDMKGDWIRDVFSEKEPETVSTTIKTTFGNCRQIAIDAPPKAHISGEKTRLAERELNDDGYNVQWTPRDESTTSPGEWMENGETLWDHLKAEFSPHMMIETFPTASTDGLWTSNVAFPLHLIDGPEFRHEINDYVDASICVVVARRSSWIRIPWRHTGTIRGRPPMTTNRRMNWVQFTSLETRIE